MKLVVGLGNPGRKYGNTRHNLGFLIVDAIALKHGVAIKKKLCDSLVGEWSAPEDKIVLVKPQTYMNRSGDAVNCLLQKFQLSSQDLIIVHDDLDLPFGRIRIRPKGGAAGHRGVFSIIESLAGASFFRVRVGIGRPPPAEEPVDFVLDRFMPEEVDRLDEAIARAADAVICLLENGGAKAMEQYNRSA